IGTSIQPKAAQVITKYSSYGFSGFYRGHWYYLWNYVLLEVIILVGHALMGLKLLKLNRRSLALALLWATLGLSVLVLIFAKYIIGIASLG
ncbi:hypothetical protein CR956_01615, partial [Candidatus Saccharibacteria bacterium]